MKVQIHLRHRVMAMILALVLATVCIAAAVLVTKTWPEKKEEHPMKQHIAIDKLTPNQGILNFSHLLDAPAGKHGFVQARDGHLVFEDGQRVRFLGFNIATRSNTPDHNITDLIGKIEAMSKKFNIDFVISASLDESELDDSLKDKVIVSL